MTAHELVARTDIARVVIELGGPELVGGRMPAFWRVTDDPNVSVDQAKGLWFDHAAGVGGGVLDLIQSVRGCDRRSALQWLADVHGVSLDQNSRPAGPDSLARWRTAERLAVELSRRRSDWLKRLRDERNQLYDVELDVSRRARAAMEGKADLSESEWADICAHAHDNIVAEGIDDEIRRVENLPALELARELGMDLSP